MTLHDVLHGFREERDMWTSTLEAKLAHQLVGFAHKPLLQVFLYVRKAYDSLDRGQCMEIMRGYGMGQNTECLITHHWYSLMFVYKASRLLGMAFVTGRGVTQGDPTPPMIFNTVVDIVVRVIDGNYWVITLFSLW